MLKPNSFVFDLDSFGQITVKYSILQTHLKINFGIILKIVCKCCKKKNVFFAYFSLLYTDLEANLRGALNQQCKLLCERSIKKFTTV